MNCGFRIADCGLNTELPAGGLDCGLIPRTPAGRLCETNPIRWGQMRETDPIRAGVGNAGTPAGKRCETNPICRNRQRPGEPIVRNKPNSAGDRAKRSQFRGLAAGTLGPVVRTNPIFRRQSCKTNPIARSGAPRRCRPGRPPRPPSFQYSTLPAFQSDASRAKQSQFALGAREWTCAGDRGFRREATAPNKANSATRTGEDSQRAGAAGRACCTNKANLPIGTPDGRAKQSQSGLRDRKDTYCV